IMAARSPVFSALFFGSMSNPNVMFIPVEDMDAHVFKALLDFIYCDEVFGEISSSMYESLCAAADRYEFSQLKEYCVNKLYEGICVKTAATVL
ncbi:hypothetical protein M569_17285, partial [Genlisea aurea]